MMDRAFKGLFTPAASKQDLGKMGHFFTGCWSPRKHAFKKEGLKKQKQNTAVHVKNTLQLNAVQVKSVDQQMPDTHILWCE